MIVKKYEARTMKEALDMVKAELGPEAIILGARDNSRRYGLVGETSVEITAAIHEDAWRKKALVESKIPDTLRDRVHRGSAKAHRELIEKSVARVDAPMANSSLKALTSGIKRANADSPNRIAMGGTIPAPTSPKVSAKPIERTQRYIDMTDEVETTANSQAINDKRRVAAQKAWSEMQKPSSEIKEIKEEIRTLKQYFVHSEKVPQTFARTYSGSDQGLAHELSPAYERLMGVGVDRTLVVELLKGVQNQFEKSAQKTQEVLHRLILAAVGGIVKIKPQTEEAHVDVFMGAGGHGKTTTLIKLASQLVLNEHKNVAVISTDNKKFGASEQLKIYCQILNVPFTIISESLQWEILADQLANFDRVLVDTSGVQFRDPEELEELSQLLPPDILNVQKHLVLSATAKDNDALEIGKRFMRLGYDDVIFTALDCSSHHGVILNFQNKIPYPLHSFGIGSNVPEDFEYASLERVMDLLLEQKYLKRTESDKAVSPIGKEF